MSKKNIVLRMYNDKYEEMFIQASLISDKIYPHHIEDLNSKIKKLNILCLFLCIILILCIFYKF